MSMLNFKKLRALPLMLAFALICVSILRADPATDCIVKGSLRISGQEAAAGTLVEAYIDGNRVASTYTTQIGEYEITIPKYDPAEPQTDGYNSEDDVVSVKVNQRDAEPDFHPQPGIIKIDLEVAISLNVKLTTWGKIKALFK